MGVKHDSDDLDLISAIWILASNDDNPLITYKGLTHRLGLSGGVDIRAIVKSRPELFRLGATQNRIEAWKKELRLAKNQPSWLREIKNEDARLRAIESISRDDVFRSQFRAQRSAERSPIEIIKWGLDHLDRVRKARSDVKDASVKKWQMWLVFGVSSIGVLSQFAIAFAKYKNWI